MSQLVVISVPLYRIARVSLSEVVLDVLRERADVVIVAPFADDPMFQANFAGQRTRFLKWTQNAMSRFESRLLAASEIMRMNGFWRRHAQRGMAYFVANESVRQERDGKDVRLSVRLRAMLWVLGQLGRSSYAWRLVDRAMGKRWYRFPELTQLAREYDRVTLLQSANWGVQDRALARLSRERGWHRVLVPYTTDQLTVNGHLLNAFDVICSQGAFETQCARELHRVPAGRLRTLGSAWFRHLDRVKAETTGGRQSFVMYAGVAATYFPRQSEFQAVDAIAEFLKTIGSPLNLVYRPVEFEQRHRREIERRFAGTGVELQWPSVSEVGLETFSPIQQREAMRSFVRDVLGCRLFIMSLVTSLGLDVAFLTGSAVIANMADPTGVLARRRTDLLTTRGWPGLRIARSRDELLAHVKQCLENPDASSRESERIVGQWDHRETEFRATLLEAVLGTAAEGGSASDAGAAA